MSKNRALLLVLISAIWFFSGWLGRGLFIDPDIRAIQSAHDVLQSQGLYVDDTQLAEAAVSAMLHSGRDTHAALLNGSMGQRYLSDFAGETGIIGLLFAMEADQTIVQSITPGGAAEAAGIRAGDILVSIDKHLLDSRITHTEIGLLLRGPVGEAVTITALRGDKELTFSPVRQARKMVSQSKMLGDIAYFAQHGFGLNAVDKVREALDSLLTHHPKAMIWDLRKNGGGSMMVARDILDFFVHDDILFQVELKETDIQTFTGKEKPVIPNFPLVILVDKYSASAAEVIALSLQEIGRATVIGNRTFGKGTIQDAVPVRDDMLMKFTVARWLSPSGISIDGTGISPDIMATDDPDTSNDEVLEIALNWLRSR